MRRGCPIIVLTILLAVVSSSVSAQEPTIAIVYGNGVDNTWTEAWRSKGVLENRLASSLSEEDFLLIEFHLAYNQKGNLLRDLSEALIQDFQTDVSQILRFLSGLDPLPDFYQDAFTEITATFDASLLVDDDLEKHVNLYKAKVLQGKKVVVVAHSQGNFFANQSFPLLSAEEQESFGVVSVANPDSFVAGDDRFFDDHYTTSAVDVVISFLAEITGNPLPPNVINGITLSDLLGHSFVKSYLRIGSNSEPKIMNDIVDIVDLLVQPPFGLGFTPSPSGNGRAVAFDPATGSLYYTITSSTNIFVTDANNTPAGSISPGIRFGALAWDSTREVLWGGGYDFGELGNVYQITPAGLKTFQFNFVPPGGNCYDQTPGFIDGLAYDEDDDTLWISDDAAFEVHHVDLSGNLIASYATPRNPRSGRRSCNTGIAVDGDFLWLALQSGPDQAPHDIVKVAKANPTIVLRSFSFSSTNIPGPEDLELDLVTVPGTVALWSNQFGVPNVLSLWKLRDAGMM